jgi:Cyclin, C-terminal domain.
MNPPVVMAAVRLFLDVLPSEISDQALMECTELSRFLSELAVCDYFFTTKRPSHIALACILTSFEGLSQDCITRSQRQYFVDCAFEVSGIDCTVAEVLDCRLRLRQLYDKGQYQRSIIERARGSGGQSPDNVAREIEYESSNGNGGMVTPSQYNMSQHASASFESRRTLMTSRYVSDDSTHSRDI